MRPPSALPLNGEKWCGGDGPERKAVSSGDVCATATPLRSWSTLPTVGGGERGLRVVRRAAGTSGTPKPSCLGPSGRRAPGDFWQARATWWPVSRTPPRQHHQVSLSTHTTSPPFASFEHQLASCSPCLSTSFLSSAALRRHRDSRNGPPSINRPQPPSPDRQASPFLMTLPD